MSHSIPSLTPGQRLIVALDVPTPAEARGLVDQLSPLVETFKLGYWLLFNPEMPDLLRAIRGAGKQFFLDAKLNDIPETVRQGVMSVAAIGADFVTVHSDDPATLEAAVEGKGVSATKIMAVTALTSRDHNASRSQFRAGVVNAQIAKCDGLIMSPSDLHDAIDVRRRVGNHMLIATPGVRLAGTSRHDHARTGTPQGAIEAGADYIIVGRPITRSEDPRAATEQFLADISRAKTEPRAPAISQWQDIAKRLVAAGQITQESTSSTSSGTRPSGGHSLQREAD